MSDLDDLPIFRPRMGRGPGRSSRSCGGSFRSALLSRLSRAARVAGRRSSARSRVSVHRPGAGARRVIVKMHVARLGANGARAASLHLRYIERDGVEKDGSKGVLYTSDGSARAEAFEEPRAGERHQFRLIISPEDAGELDLTLYVRRVMARAQRDLGRELEWAAVNHYNTEHPHAHVVIRGVDRSGQELRLDRGYISNGLRWSAQEIATEELGPRRGIELRRTYTREITQERFTSLDRELEQRTVEGRIDVQALARPGRVDRTTLVGRLEYLESLRLAERRSASSWSLSGTWQADLRELGSRGDILKQIHAAISGDRSRYHIVREGQALETGGVREAPVLTGRVASKGLSDELKGAMYAVIETPRGHAYHVPLAARLAEDIRPGDIVSFTTKPEAAVRPVDRHIAEVSRARGGVYALDVETGDPTARSAGGRLRELERFGLAKPAGPNRWTVSPNLVTQLEERARTAPAKHHLFIRKEPLSLEQQVRHPGPAWLDRVDAASLAPYGFGAELRRAARGRSEVLRQLCVAPDDPKRHAALSELDRRALGKQIAARSGQVFLSATPDRLRGRVQLAEAPGGASYAVVSDGVRFAVLRTTTLLRAMEGKAVVISRDPTGRLVVRQDIDRGLGR